MSVASVRAANDEKIRERIFRAYEERVEAIADRIRAAQKDSQLPETLDPDAFARMIVSIMQSLAARARIGAGVAELTRLAGSFTGVLFPEPG